MTNKERVLTVEELIAERMRARAAMRQEATQDQPKANPMLAALLFAELYS